MISIKYFGRDYQLATDWSELELKDLLTVCKIRIQVAGVEDSSYIYAARISMFGALSNMPYQVLRHINAEEWIDILPHIDWAFKTPKLKENPLKFFSIASKKYIAPPDKFSSITFKEFIDIDTAFLRFTQTGTVNDLKYITAICYRPKRKDLLKFERSEQYNGDDREPYNYERAKIAHQLFIRNLSIEKAYLVMLYYESMRNLLLVNNPKMGVLFNSAQSSSGTTWIDTALELSSTKFGTFDQLMNEDFMIVLYELVRLIEKTTKK